MPRLIPPSKHRPQRQPLASAPTDAVAISETKRRPQRQPQPQLQSLAYGPTDAAAVAGVGRSAIWLAMKSGALPYRSLGRRRIILVQDMRVWLDSLPRSNAPSQLRRKPRPDSKPDTDTTEAAALPARPAAVSQSAAGRKPRPDVKPARH